MPFESAELAEHALARRRVRPHRTVRPACSSSEEPVSREHTERPIDEPPKRLRAATARCCASRFHQTAFRCRRTYVTSPAPPRASIRGPSTARKRRPRGARHRQPQQEHLGGPWRKTDDRFGPGACRVMVRGYALGPWLIRMAIRSGAYWTCKNGGLSLLHRQTHGMTFPCHRCARRNGGCTFLRCTRAWL
jgi:hypothetical protein